MTTIPQTRLMASQARPKVLRTPRQDRTTVGSSSGAKARRIFCFRNMLRLAQSGPNSPLSCQQSTWFSIKDDKLNQEPFPLLYEKSAAKNEQSAKNKKDKTKEINQV